MPKRTCHWFACFLLLVASGWAQEFRATLNGTVSDAQGAFVPGAKIAVVQVETGATTNTVSGPSGQFTVPFLSPGVYTVTAAASGFKQYQREGIQLSTNQRVTLDVKLEVGSLNESVTITADAPVLTTATASVGQPITVGQVDNMPMSGRAPMALAQLSMGVMAGTNPQANSRPFDNSGTSTFAIGGGQMSTNELLMDGGPNMSQNRRTAYNPPLDSVQEVKVELFQTDAGYGDTSGGTINIVTKGGTNQLHGAAGWYNQVSALAANQFFTNAIGGKKLATLFNQYGISANGPLVLPKIFNGKNKVFWAFSYEGIQHTVPQPYTLTVPTAAEKGGDFSALLSVGSNYQLYDPATGVVEGSRRRRQPFAGNIIPKDRFSAIAKKYLDFYPAPNQAGRADGQDNYLAGTKRHDDYFTALSRMDFNLTDSHKVYWRLYRAYRTEYIRKYFDNVASGEIRPRDVEGSTVDDVYMLTPTMVLNTRANWNRFWDADHRQSLGYDVTSLGFPASLAAKSQQLVMPVVAFGDATQTLGGTGQTAGSGFVTPFDTFQLFSTVSKVQGQHSFKFGFDGRFMRESSLNYAYSSGLYTFSTNWTRGPLDNSTAAPLGQSLASFLLGLPTSGNFDVNGARTNQSWYASGFLQDDWRITQRLTLNLGVRYEKETGTIERYNRTLAGWDATSTNRVTAAAKAAYATTPITEIPAAQFNPLGGPVFATSQHRAIYSTASNGLTPRVGLAWKPAFLREKTVLRAGFGLFFQPYSTMGVNQPGFSQPNTMVVTQDGYLTPYATLANPFPDGILQPVGAADGINTFLGQSLTYTNPSVSFPYNTRWTFTIQHQLGRNLVLEAAYLGSHGVHLPITNTLNYVPAKYLSTSLTRDTAVINRLTANVTNPFQGLLPGSTLNGSTTTVAQLLQQYPQLTGLTMSSANEGTADYHAVDVRIEKRLSSGLQLLTSFSLSRMMEATSRLNPTDAALERGVANEDRPYRLTISGSYQLPIGKGKRLASNAGDWLNRLVGGWIISGIQTLQGGAVLSWGNVIYYGGDLNYDARKIGGAFDKTRFNTNSTQQLANNIRTFPSRFSNLRADRINNLEAALIKAIPLREPLHAQFRLEAFNVVNHTQFNTPTLTPTSSNFGVVTSQANWSRVLQMALRITW